MAVAAAAAPARWSEARRDVCVRSPDARCTLKSTSAPIDGTMVRILSVSSFSRVWRTSAEKNQGPDLYMYMSMYTTHARGFDRRVRELLWNAELKDELL